MVEVAGLTSFSFGEDDECRYVMIFKKVKSPNACPALSFSACAPQGDRPDAAWVWNLTPWFLCPQEFAPSDEELDSYRRGEEWDPQKAEEKRKLKVSSVRQPGPGRGWGQAPKRWCLISAPLGAGPAAGGGGGPAGPRGGEPRERL